MNTKTLLAELRLHDPKLLVCMSRDHYQAVINVATKNIRVVNKTWDRDAKQDDANAVIMWATDTMPDEGNFTVERLIGRLESANDEHTVCIAAVGYEEVTKIRIVKEKEYEYYLNHIFRCNKVPEILVLFAR